MIIHTEYLDSLKGYLNESNMLKILILLFLAGVVTGYISVSFTVKGRDFLKDILDKIKGVKHEPEDIDPNEIRYSCEEKTK